MRATGPIAGYCAGLFPMDEDPPPPELPWWTVDPRTIFELDAASLARTRRAVRRSLAAAGDDWGFARDRAFEPVLDACAQPRSADDGVWLSDRMRALYRQLRAGGFATTFELWSPDADLLAGIVGVRVGRAAMLESMFHRRPHAGNVLLVRTLEALAASGVVLCDVQTPTDHTTRLGAVPIPRAEYEARLRAALR